MPTVSISTRWLLGVRAIFGAVLLIATTVGLAAPAEIEEIIVTARKVEESIQSVPVAITAITSEQMRDQSINNAYDLVHHTAGLTLRAGSASRNYLNYFIRGQGTTFGTAPGVIVYFNDVAQRSGLAGTNVQLFDLESVQVLKGPQGTLFGKSSTGGAVLYNPQKPTDEFDAFIEVKSGARNSQEYTGAINIPFAEGKVNLRLAANVIRADGWTKSTTTNQKLDERRRESYRIGLDIRPTDWFDTYTMFTGNNVNEASSGGALIGYNPNLPLFGAAGAGTAYYLCSFVFHPGDPAGAAACLTTRLGRFSELSSQLAGEFARVDGGGSIRQTMTNQDNYSIGQNQQIINTTRVSVGEFGFLGEVTLKNIFSAYRDRKGAVVREICAAAFPHCIVINGHDLINNEIVHADTSNDFSDNLNNEFQILGDINGKHNWILGYYYENQDRGPSYPPIFPPFNNAFTFPLDTKTFLSNRSSESRTKETGIFGQITLELTEGLRVTGGYRHVKNFSDTTTVKNVMTPQGLQSGDVINDISFRGKADTWTISTDYQATDNWMVYAAHRRGFKPGGTNGTALGVIDVIPGVRKTYDPEVIDDIEFGSKLDWVAGDIAGRTNIAIYKTWYEDVQRNQTLIGPAPNFQTFTQVNNIAAADIWGIEIENTVALSENLQAYLNYAYIDAQYAEYPGTTTDINGVVHQNVDSPYTGTPEHQGSIGGRYQLPLEGSLGRMALSMNYYFQSGVFVDDSGLNDPIATGHQGGYGILNGRLEWANIGGSPIDAAFFVKNIEDKEILLGIANFLPTLASQVGFYNEPRTWGLELRARFGASDNR